MLQSNCNNVWANRYHVALDTVFAHTDLYKHCIPTLGHIHSLINKTVFPKGLRWHTADHNFQFSILHFQLKRISRTRQMPYSGEFFIYSHIHFVQALAKIIRHREGLQAFQGEHTYQQQPFQPFQRVFLLFRGMNE